jgi:hypothetical protein
MWLACSSRAVLHVHRVLVVGPMVVVARHLVHRLVQGAAKGDVRFLEAAADGQQRHAALKHLGNDGQRPGIAVRVQRKRGIQHRLFEVTGVHIRRRAGEQYAVRHIEQRVQFFRCSAGHDQGLAACESDGVDILPADRVERMVADHAVACGHKDDRFAGLGDCVAHWACGDRGSPRLPWAC